MRNLHRFDESQQVKNPRWKWKYIPQQHQYKLKYIQFFQGSRKRNQKDDYNDYFMKYLINIKDGEDEKYDRLANKNSKFYSTISMTT